jgi:SAM-dependent methyltransferase
VPGDYAVLAPVYDEIGLSAFAQRFTPILIDYAQRIDWLGRRVVVLGCGTGGSIEYLSHYPYSIIGIDSAPEMLEIARQKMQQAGVSVRWFQQDIRELGPNIGSAEMVLGLNVMNELNSLRDLETVFSGVSRVLDQGKLFIFDMVTVQGLTEDGHKGDTFVHNDVRKLTVFATNDYDYERQMHTSQYTIFRREGDLWRRSEARRILRAFPIQAVASLLQRTGFNISRILNTNLEVFDPASSRAARVIFVAEKQ